MPAAPSLPPLPGTRPEGAQDEGAAARQVREMFARIAPRYDFLNHLLSLSLDRLWRARTARRFRHVLAKPGACVLDLCCGTGDLTLALAREAHKQRGRESGGPANAPAIVLGVDFVHPMLVRAVEKTSAQREDRSSAAFARGVSVAYVEADALQLPFAEASFDLVTAAFGFRNLANYRRGLEEIRRVLKKPGGQAGILEFAAPERSLWGRLYRLYFTRLLPRIGGAISGSREAYAYLPQSVESFPEPEMLSEAMRAAGFADVRYERWTAGIVALHTARRPEG